MIKATKPNKVFPFGPMYRVNRFRRVGSNKPFERVVETTLLTVYQAKAHLGTDSMGGKETNK